MPGPGLSTPEEKENEVRRSARIAAIMLEQATPETQLSSCETSDRQPPYDIQNVAEENKKTDEQEPGKNTHNRSSACGSNRPSTTSSANSTASVRRKKLEIELSYAKKEREQLLKVMNLEKALEMAKIDEEISNQDDFEVDASVYEDSEATVVKNRLHAPSRVSKWVKESTELNSQNGFKGFKSTTKPQIGKEADVIEISKPPAIEKLHQLDNPVIENKETNAQPTTHENNEKRTSCNEFESAISVVSSDGCSRHHLDMEKFLIRQSMPTDLPKFDGNPLEWSTFISQFRLSTRLCSISNIENLVRLQKCIIGKAREAVASLLILPHNVDKVLEILENRFGRSEHIIFLLLEKVRQFPHIRAEKLDELLNFYDSLTNLVYTLESLKQTDHIRNPILYRETLDKLPMGQKLSFIQYYDDITNRIKDPPLLELHKWLSKRVNAASQLVLPFLGNEKTNSKSTNSSAKAKAMTFAITDESKKVNDDKFKQTYKKCLFCESTSHFVSDCDKFKNLDVNKRWEIITKNKACISCLRTRHAMKFCKYRKTCSFKECLRTHHPLLHNDDVRPKTNSSISQITDGQQSLPTQTSTTLHIAQQQSVILKILPVQLTGPNSTINTFALLDDASTVSLIETDLANQLGLDGPVHNLKLKWTNDVYNEESNSKIVSVKIQGFAKETETLKPYTLRKVRTVSGLALPCQTVNVSKLSENYPYMSKFEHLSYSDAQPTILIGQDNWPVIATRTITNGSWNGPTASKTLLGWTIHGNVSESESSATLDVNSTFHVYDIAENKKCCDDLNTIENLLKEQWDLDVSGTLRPSETETDLSVHDKRCLKIMDKTIRRKDNHYECGLLWKTDDVVLPESYSNAFARLRTLERKMDRNKEYAEKYEAKMNEYLDKGYIRKLTKTEANVYSPRTWYLPHFGIINPNKPDKLRIVFDAAAKSDGKCLNDFLHPGLDLYNSLITILSNFRIHKYAFVADIKEMFLQVSMNSEDRFAQRFLWRSTNRTEAPDVYEITVLFFGATCSPCIAQEIRNRNAKEFLSERPKACEDIIFKHYMDDYLGGSDSLDKATELINDVIDIHKRGGFAICNWITNSPELTERIKPDLRAAIQSQNENTSERILGMWWDFKTDNFSYQLNFKKIDPIVLNSQRCPTKREVLRIIMSIYDPLGFLANFVILGKILMQSIWESGIDWDDLISETQFVSWKTWSEQFSLISHFRIPRQFSSFPLNETDIQLHIFCDASDNAYATVAYFRFMHKNDIQTVLVTAKARVAPLKPTSVPRLELQAAVIGARIGNYIKSNIDLQINVTFFWTDSQVVLSWIRSNSRRFKVFVAQRIGEIHSLTDPKQWKYVPSKENIADDGTKAKQFDFSPNSRWLNGPSFLRQPPSEWPNSKFDLPQPNDLGSEEIKSDFVAAITEIPTILFPVPDVARFSKWTNFVRSTAWLFHYIAYLKRQKPLIKELQPEEIAKAEILIFKKLQHDSYATELKLLAQKKPLSKQSPLHLFTLFIDKNGLIRIQGRLENATELSCESKHPIILDRRHPITKLLIRHYHVRNNHIGIETVISEIREKYWITNIRNAIKHIALDCQYCKNIKANPKVPIMGQLPQCRVETCARPFLKTGVDCFGPIEILVNRRIEKRYGVIFTCMAMRAVHIEIAQDMSSNSFIHVLRQFAARRGYPQMLVSDNGTNFIKANKDIKNAMELWSSEEITRFCTTNNCKWVFNPPAAPHMGGVWERLIQTIKKHLSFVLKERHPKEYVLRTLLCEIEHIVNSRPITYVSTDVNDPRPLTPNDLLIGPSSCTTQFTLTDDKDLIILSNWRASQRLADLFWKRWVKEFLPNHLNSHKWIQENKNIDINDVVLIVDPSMPRNVWPKGKIVQTFPSKDGRVRVVDVQTCTGIYKRPVTKIIKLDIVKKSNSF